MITPHYINEHKSDLRGIKPGSNLEGCIAGITWPYGWSVGCDPLPEGC
jgi:hypothetical protein